MNPVEQAHPLIELDDGFLLWSNDRRMLWWIMEYDNGEVEEIADEGTFWGAYLYKGSLERVDEYLRNVREQRDPREGPWLTDMELWGHFDHMGYGVRTRDEAASRAVTS